MQLPPRFSQPISSPGNRTSTRGSQPRRLLCLCTALLLTFAAALAHAQDYTSIVVFGDSLSDTGNFADLTQAKYLVRIPGPDADYTDGRFTDGDDTLPMAQKYFGVWIEQFAAMLPSKPRIMNSLDGGTNYAYGDATDRKRHLHGYLWTLGLALRQRKQYWPAGYRLSRHHSRDQR